MRIRPTLGPLLAGALALSTACDRNVEPFDPNERVQAPDLVGIFPPGAERARPDAPGTPPPPRGAPPRGAPPPGEASQAIRGTVRLSPTLEGRVPGGAVLFLIARSGEGGPPVAVKRIPEPRFPLEFQIGPEDRMIATLPFTGPFRIAARVDADRNATSRTPGDLQGETTGRVEPGSQDVEILIDEIL